MERKLIAPRLRHAVIPGLEDYSGSSLGQTFYFCAVTALTIGYGDVVPTTTPGRIFAVSLGLLGVLITGVVTASAVYAIQVSGHRAGLRIG